MDEKTICKCTRCKNGHKYSERIEKRMANGFGTESVCPRCECRSFYDRTKLEITVKDNQQTFTARCLGKTASCTANPAQAAMSCAKKVLPGYEFTLTEQPNGRSFHQTFLAEAKVV